MKKIINKDQSVIPRGYYCYDSKGKCPYWQLREDKPNQENGYCKFMEKGDWEMDIELLWDQCKECGINEYTDEELKDMIEQNKL